MVESVPFHWRTGSPIDTGTIRTACGETLPQIGNNFAFWSWHISRSEANRGRPHFHLCPACAAIQAAKGTTYHAGDAPQ